MNLNTSISVELNDFGKEILRKRSEELGYSYLLHSPREDGRHYFMLWELMNIFGGALSMGGEMPFAGGNFEVCQ